MVVGREGEIAELTAALCASTAESESWLVLGEAGVGKSTLVKTVAERCSTRDWMWGRSSSSQVAPLRPLVEVLAAARRAVGEEAGVDGVAVVLGTHAELGAAAAAEAFVDVLGHYWDSGVTYVVMEDLHWADWDTLAVLDVLVDRIGEAGCRLVMTARSDEIGAQGPVIASWEDRRSVGVVSLEPLDRDAVGLLIAELLDGAVR